MLLGELSQWEAKSKDQTSLEISLSIPDNRKSIKPKP